MHRRGYGAASNTAHYTARYGGTNDSWVPKKNKKNREKVGGNCSEGLYQFVETVSDFHDLLGRLKLRERVV